VYRPDDLEKRTKNAIFRSLGLKNKNKNKNELKK
jgi:hypothetical protein